MARPARAPRALPLVALALVPALLAACWDTRPLVGNFGIDGGGGEGTASGTGGVTTTGDAGHDTGADASADAGAEGG